MASDRNFTYMLKFARQDFARYIAHLDWIRIVQSSLDRSSLPLVYTEGYSPKAKLKFSPPLPVGCASECELVLIFLTENLSENTVLSSLENSMPDGMPLTNVQFMQISLKNPFQAINSALYEMLFPFEMAHEQRIRILDVCMGGPLSGIADNVSLDQSGLIVKVVNEEEYLDGVDRINLVAKLEEGKTFHPVKFAIELNRGLNLPHLPQPKKLAFLNIDEKVARKLFQFD